MSSWRAWHAEAVARRANAGPEAFEWRLPDDTPEAMRGQWTRRDALRDAPICWGVPCLIGSELLHEGRAFGWATMIYSPDLTVRDNPAFLDYAANKAGQIWESTSRPPFLHAFHRQLRGDRPYGSAPLPEAIAGPYSVFICRVFMPRAWLPGERVRFDFMPILALPEPKSPIMVLPAQLWPEEMAAMWAASDDDSAS